MRKLNLRFITISLVAIASLSFAAITFAQGGGNPHFTELNCFQDGNDARCVGKVAGLGNRLGTIEVTADADVTCINPGGQTPPPWSERIVGYGFTEPIRRNGAQSFDVIASPTGRDCPNANWTLQVLRIYNIQATVTR